MSWILLVVVFACNQNPMLSYANTIRQRTAPPGGATTSVVDAGRSKASVGFSWDVLTSWSWDQYGQWLTRELAPDFMTSQRESDVLIFTRRVNGDSYRLECRRAPAQTGMTVHITFTAAAD
jgi:hypothetical protein